MKLALRGLCAVKASYLLIKKWISLQNMAFILFEQECKSTPGVANRSPQ